MTVKPSDVNLNPFGNSPLDIINLNSSIVSDKSVLELVKTNKSLFISKNNLDNFKKIFKLKSSDKKLKLLVLYFEFYVVSASFLKQLELYQFNFNKFNNDFNNRTNKLKNDLLKKYPFFNEFIEDSFNSLNITFNNDIKNLSFFLNIFDSHPDIAPLKKKKGRPSNIILDKLLPELNELAEKIDPNNKYPNIIIPFFKFIHQLNPELIEINEFNSAEKIRQRMKYLRKSNPNKKKAGE